MSVILTVNLLTQAASGDHRLVAQVLVYASYVLNGHTS